MVEIGCHLCSEFSISDKGRDYVGKREALTTPERIRTCLNSISRVHGLVVARKSLRYVVPCTASPMEVLLVITFSLPPEYGGWAMPEIVANQRIDVDERLRPLVGEKYFKGDIYLPSVRGNIEYDSYEYHTASFATTTRRRAGTFSRQWGPRRSLQPGDRLKRSRGLRRSSGWWGTGLALSRGPLPRASAPPRKTCMPT